MAQLKDFSSGGCKADHDWAETDLKSAIIGRLQGGWHVKWVHLGAWTRSPRATCFRTPASMVKYSWIAHQLDIGRTPAFLLSMFHFKSETCFGFLIKNYTGHVFWIFCKTSKQARLASFRVLKVFSRGFRHSTGDWAQNRFLLSRTIVCALRAYGYVVRA